MTHHTHLHKRVGVSTEGAHNMVGAVEIAHPEQVGHKSELLQQLRREACLWTPTQYTNKGGRRGGQGSLQTLHLRSWHAQRWRHGGRRHGSAMAIAADRCQHQRQRRA